MKKLREVIEELIKNKQYEEALLKAKELLDIATNNGDTLYIALANKKVGIINYELQRYLEAEPYLLKTIKYLSEHKDMDNLCDIRNMLAISYARLQKNQKAKELFEKNAEYYKSKKNTEKVIASLLNIATIYDNIGELAYSTIIYKECLNILKKENLPKMMAMTLFNLGESYLAANDLNNSSKYLNKAIIESKKSDNKNVLARAYDSLAGVYFNRNKLNEALEKEEMASKVLEQIYDKSLFSNIQLNKAQILFSLSSPKKALEILESVFVDIKNLNNLNKLSKYYHLKSKIYESIGNFKEAYYSIIENNKLLKQMNDIEGNKLLNEGQKRANRLMTELKNEQKKIENMKIIEKQRLMLMQKSKLESLGQMASGIAHEINQPLGAITFALDNLHFKFEQNKLSKDYLEQKWRLLKDNLDRISEIISQIRTFSQTQKFFRMEKINLNKLIKDTLILLRTQYKNHNIDIELDLNKDIGFTVISRNQMKQVLLNLLSNARYAVEKKHEKSNDINSRKKIFIRTFSDDTNVYLEVEDNGIGISQEDIKNIFDPFFTTKDVDHGTGLGLSITLGIIQKMHATIEFKSEKDKYTIATIKLAKFVEKNKVAEQLWKK